MASSRRTRIALLAGLACVGVATSRAQEPAPETTDHGETSEGGTPEAGVAAPGFPDWPQPPTETPIADSIEPAVDRFVRQHFGSCESASAGVPCFPVSVEVKGRRYSVIETLENLQLDDRPAPGPPTADEMIQYGANPRPASAGVGFSAGALVCKTKQLLRNIGGQSRTWYLYRTWDETGERAVLRDRPFDAEKLAPSPGFHYALLGEFGDECEAIQGYRKSTHEVRMRREALEAEGATTPSVEPRPTEPPRE
jgi:hypothetical protein